MQRYTYTLLSLMSKSHTKDIGHFTSGDQVSTLSRKTLHIMLNVKFFLCKCNTWTSEVSLNPLPEQHTPWVMSPISFRMKVEQIFMSITDGEDQTISSNEPHLHQVLKIMLFKWQGETWERFTEQPKGLQYLDNFQYYCMDFLTVPNA